MSLQVQVSSSSVVLQEWTHRSLVRVRGAKRAKSLEKVLESHQQVIRAGWLLFFPLGGSPSSQAASFLAILIAWARAIWRRSVRGREAFKHLFAAYLAACDFHLIPEFLMAGGDMVVVRETHRLKHKGEFQGIPLTGKEVSVTGCLGDFAYLFLKTRK